MTQLKEKADWAPTGVTLVISIALPSSRQCSLTFTFKVSGQLGIIFLRLFFFFWHGPFLKPLSNLLYFCFHMIFWLFGHKACGILAPHSGIKPSPPPLEDEVLTTGRPGKSPPQCHFMLRLLCSLNSHQLHEADEQWTQGTWWFLKAKEEEMVVEESFISMDVSRNLQLEDVRAVNAWPGIVSAALCSWFLVPQRHWWLWGLWKFHSWYWGGVLVPFALTLQSTPQTSALLPGSAFLC